jgi:hypothetical protein
MCVQAVRRKVDPGAAMEDAWQVGDSLSDSGSTQGDESGDDWDFFGAAFDGASTESFDSLPEVAQQIATAAPLPVAPPPIFAQQPAEPTEPPKSSKRPRQPRLTASWGGPASASGGATQPPSLPRPPLAVQTRQQRPQGLPTTLAPLGGAQGDAAWASSESSLHYAFALELLRSGATGRARPDHLIEPERAYGRIFLDNVPRRRSGTDFWECKGGKRGCTVSEPLSALGDDPDWRVQRSYGHVVLRGKDASGGARPRKRKSTKIDPGMAEVKVEVQAGSANAAIGSGKRDPAATTRLNYHEYVVVQRMHKAGCTPRPAGQGSQRGEAKEACACPFKPAAGAGTVKDKGSYKLYHVVAPREWSPADRAAPANFVQVPTLHDLQPETTGVYHTVHGLSMRGLRRGCCECSGCRSRYAAQLPCVYLYIDIVSVLRWGAPAQWALPMQGRSENRTKKSRPY